MVCWVDFGYKKTGLRAMSPIAHNPKAESSNLSPATSRNPVTAMVTGILSLGGAGQFLPGEAGKKQPFYQDQS